MKKSILLIFCSVFALFSYSQEKDVYCDYYSVNDGLSDNMINDIKTDSNGLIWIATQNGLSRFDGSHFINFSSKTHSNFFTNNQVDHIYSYKNMFYLISQQYGLIKFDPIHLNFEKIVNQGLMSMFMIGDTAVYFFKNGELQVHVKNKLYTKKKYESTDKASISIFNEKIFIAIKDYGIEILGLKKLNFIKNIPSSSMPLEGMFYNSKKNGLIYSSGDLVYIFNEKLELFPHPLIDSSSHVSFYSEDFKNMPIYIIDEKIPHLYYDSTVTAFISTCVENAQARCMFRIDENNYVLGTNQGLLFTKKQLKISSSINDNNLYSKNTVRVRRKIIEDTLTNTLYFLGYPGIVSYDYKNLKLIKTKISSTYDGILFDSKIYCATEGGGLISYSILTQKVEQKITKDILPNDYILCITKYNDSLLILGGKNKIVIYNPKRNSSKKYDTEKNIEIQKIEKDNKSNSFWLATNMGLYNAKIDLSNNLNYSRFKSNYSKVVKDILIIPEKNQIWLATNEGVLVCDKSDLRTIKHYSSKDEVSHPKVVSLLLDDNQNVWASTYSGLTMYNLKKYTIYFISKNNNLKNIEYNHKAAIKLKNGNLIFGGLNTYDIVYPNNIEKIKYKTDFFISAIKTICQNKEPIFVYPTTIDEKEFSFYNGEEELKIYFANKDYANGKAYKFEYKINSGEWIPLTNNIVSISNMPSGNYSLKVKMTNPFSKMSSEKTYVISALIPFYQNTVFLISLLLIITLLAIISYLSLKRSMVIETETKSRIAMDLHDETGTILTRLSLLLSKKKNIENEKEQMSEGLKEALFSMRAFMNSLTNFHLTVQDLEDELKEFITKQLQSTTIESKIETPKTKNYVLKNELYRDIKLCVYEILNNSIKHSKCSIFEIKINVDHNQLIIELKDNGCVDDINQLKQQGNGIRNIKKRTKRNNGTCDLKVLKGTTGLCIELKFPIK